MTREDCQIRCTSASALQCGNIWRVRRNHLWFQCFKPLVASTMTNVASATTSPNALRSTNKSTTVTAAESVPTWQNPWSRKASSCLRNSMSTMQSPGVVASLVIRHMPTTLAVLIPPNSGMPMRKVFLLLARCSGSQRPDQLVWRRSVDQGTKHKHHHVRGSPEDLSNKDFTKKEQKPYSVMVVVVNSGRTSCFALRFLRHYPAARKSCPDKVH